MLFQNAHIYRFVWSQVSFHMNYRSSKASLTHKKTSKKRKRMKYVIMSSYEITLTRATVCRNSCWVCFCAHPIDVRLRPDRWVWTPRSSLPKRCRKNWTNPRAAPAGTARAEPVRLRPPRNLLLQPSIQWESKSVVGGWTFLLAKNEIRMHQIPVLSCEVRIVCPVREKSDWSSYFFSILTFSLTILYRTVFYTLSSIIICADLPLCSRNRLRWSSLYNAVDSDSITRVKGS